MKPIEVLVVSVVPVLNNIMFQAIHYDYYTKTAYLRDDELGWQIFEYYPTYYKIDPNGEYDTLDGKKARPTQKYDREDPNLYEKDKDRCNSILMDIYLESDEVPSFHKNVFLDIETEMGGAINLEYCQRAPSKITSIAIYDATSKEYIVWILDPKNKIESKSSKGRKVISCTNENYLLSAFLDMWQEIDPTNLIHWNGDNFDVPYLYNRMRKILGDQKAKSLSPIGIVQFDERDLKMPYKIGGINSMDYLRLYKKFIPKQQPSYSLDAISNTELGYGKIKYEGSLDHLYNTDIDKFIEYNINDVKLIVDIDEKKKFLDLAIMLGHMGHVPYHYVYQSSRLIEGAIMTYLKRKNIVSPNKPTTINPELKLQLAEENEDDDKFAGAYVKEPVPGLYGWNIDLDEQSLYPLTILQLNASPETLLFKIITSDPLDMSWTLKQMKEKNPEMKIQCRHSNGRVYYTKLKKIIRFIVQNEAAVAPNGTVYSTDETGIICEVVEDWFRKRNEFKALMKKHGKLGDDIKYAFYDQMQSTMKIFLNSIYGVLGLKSFRYSDGEDILAESVTISGRFIITQTADYINHKINKELSNY